MPPTLDISEARKSLSSMERRLKDDNVIYITRHNKSAFAVVDIDYLSALIETVEVLSDPDVMQMLLNSLEDVRAGRVRSQDEVAKELG